MKTETVYVNRDNLGTVKCPNCGIAKSVRAEKFKGPKRSVQIRCKCGTAFRVVFEFRKACRKETHLPGYYAKLATGNEGGQMLVRNISVTGIGFHAAALHNLHKGDMIKVKFIVDRMWNMLNRKRSEIERNAVVRWVKDRQIGCEFLSSVAYDTVNAASGFFLVP